MFLADCHNHTQCSADCEESLLRVAEQAGRVGLSMVCTTDHLDLLGRSGKVLEHWDWQPCVAQLERARSQCPKGLELRMGIEINVPHLFPERARQLLSEADLDLVVGSAHNLQKDGLDFCEWTYPDESRCYEALDDYFDSLLAMSVMEEVDILAHIPYTLRYMNDRDGNHAVLNGYYERIEAILSNLIRRGAGMELNTNRGKSLADYRPILERYHNLGGEIVTLGSDAHVAQDIGKGIPEAAQLLKELGFRYYTVYRRRKPEFIPL